MRGARRKWQVAVGVAASALVLAACSSSGGREVEEGGGEGGTGGSVDTERYTIAMITHEAPGDSFWDKIRAGAEDAAAAHNVDLQYSNDPSAAEQANLIQQAIDSDVDAIATTLVTPDALAGAVEAATAADIPVIGFNSGIDQYQELGALMYFGSDENLAGETAGTRITEAGGQKPLCVIQAAGSVALETRCAGVKANAPATENLQVNGEDIPSVTSTLSAKLQQDPSIDYIVTLGAPIAMAALDAVDQAGSEAQVVTFDLSADAAAAIQDGRIQFSIDQQPYVQGYLSVASLWLHLSNGNDIGGGQAVLTGPSFVDAENIDVILPFAENNTR